MPASERELVKHYPAHSVEIHRWFSEVLRDQYYFDTLESVLNSGLPDIPAVLQVMRNVYKTEIPLEHGLVSFDVFNNTVVIDGGLSDPMPEQINDVLFKLRITLHYTAEKCTHVKFCVHFEDDDEQWQQPIVDDYVRSLGSNPCESILQLRELDVFGMGVFFSGLFKNADTAYGTARKMAIDALNLQWAQDQLSVCSLFESPYRRAWTEQERRPFERANRDTICRIIDDFGAPSTTIEMCGIVLYPEGHRNPQGALEALQRIDPEAARKCLEWRACSQVPATAPATALANQMSTLTIDRQPEWPRVCN